jgi:hypothetical protein
VNYCLFCGGDTSEPGHAMRCDGRQGAIEAAAPFADDVPQFNGADYQPAVDHARLAGQILRIWDLMVDGRWRTLAEIETTTGDPQASISAQLRHLRKPRFGEHQIERRRRGDEHIGLYEYRLIPNIRRSA